MEKRNLFILTVYYIISLVIFLQCISIQEEIKVESDEYIYYINTIQVYGTDTLKFKDYYGF